MPLNAPVQFKYNVEQTVILIPLKLEARIMARCDEGCTYHCYRISFWSEGKKSEEWVYEPDLSEKK